MSAWRNDGRSGVVVLVIVAVIAGVIWYRVGVGGGAHNVAAATRSTSATRAATSLAAVTTTTAGDRVVVHVAGAVVHPGVVELRSGSRVIDAVEAAGGGRLDADLDRLNLAAKLVDGERVLVQRAGDPAAAADVSGSVSSDGGGTGTGGGTGLVNLNTATQAQLEELPGIGPSLASGILSERQRRGGFRSVNELRDVHGIGEKRFADLRSRVTV